MAFTSVILETGILPGGRAYERGTWDGTSVTTGTITASTSSVPEIVKIEFATAADDADNAVICALDAGDTAVKLTFTSGDTGTYYIEGMAG